MEIPAFEMEMVCCSMTSWMAVRSIRPLLLFLVNMVHFEVGVSEKASVDGLETGIRHKKENASEVNNVAWVHEARDVAINMNGH